MKFRSLLLVACMLFVPAVAMFSHFLPGDLRLATRRHCSALVESWFGTPAEAGPFATEPTHRPDVPAEQQSAASGPAMVPQERTPIAPVAGASSVPETTTKPAPGGPAAGPVQAGAATVRAGVTSPMIDQTSATPALVAQMADRTRQARDQQSRELETIAAQLRLLGAVSLAFQPAPGSDGMFTSGCRVPVDATGQLQRVFQATGHDPATASLALLEQVKSWRQRTGQPPTGSGSAALEPPAAVTPAEPPFAPPVMTDGRAFPAPTAGGR